jgi:hypothetical protein
MKSTSQHIRRIPRRLLPLVALLFVAGTVSAAVFTMYYATSTATVKTPDLQLVAGSDSTEKPTIYPAATVTVASTYDYASVGFSLFPSAGNSPQPATYYTNLLQIKNTGSATHNIDSVTISSITGASNLGSITIYLYADQTDTPQTGIPIASATLTSASSGTITLLKSPGTEIKAEATMYVEIVGYAAAEAKPDSTIGFTTAISWT